MIDSGSQSTHCLWCEFCEPTILRESSCGTSRISKSRRLPSKPFKQHCPIFFNFVQAVSQREGLQHVRERILPVLGHDLSTRGSPSCNTIMQLPCLERTWLHTLRKKDLHSFCHLVFQKRNPLRNTDAPGAHVAHRDGTNCVMHGGKMIFFLAFHTVVWLLE